MGDNLGMRRRVVLFALLLAAGAGPGGGLQAGREAEAPGYLRQAIAEFRRGAPDRARFYFNIARELDQNYTDRDPAARRLDAMLHFAGGDYRAAISRIVEGSAAAPDPFLVYTMARLQLDRAPAAVARRAFLQSARQGLERSGADREAEPAALHALSPLACPPEDPELAQTWLLAASADPYRNAFLYGPLFDRSMDIFEVALAAGAALFLSAPANQEGSERTATRQLLTTATARAEPIPFAEMHQPLFALLREPDNDDRHRACLRNLDQLEQRLRDRIESGSVEPATTQLRFVRSAQDRMHTMRSTYFHSADGAFAFGKHLARTDRALPALHAFRLAFLRSLAQRPPDDGAGVAWQDRRQLIELSQSLRQLELSYLRLSREADARTSGAMARILEARIAAPDNQLDDLRIQLRQRAGENLANREALLLLLRGAREGKDADPLRQRRLEDKLRQRDGQMDDRELLSAYDYAALRP